jgi:uncharacterized protein (DUF2141 family)
MIFPIGCRWLSWISEIRPMRYLPSSLLVPALLSLVGAAGAAVADTTIRVVVTNIAKPDGVLLAGAYISPETWLGPDAVAGKEVPVAGNVLDGTVTFELLLPPGSYALSLFQDMNGNRKLDTNFIGVPTEPSGSSNDAPAKWRAPKFRDAVFTVGDQPMELRITLK